jgi:Ca2+-binding RTX toxin-like protein
LYGDGGNDLINGGLGQDTLTGGAGNDIFAFTTALDGLPNVDRITEYSVADDTIQLENSVFTALTSTGILSADHFIVGSAAADADDFFIYNPATGALYYDADGNGVGAKAMFASLDHNLALTHSDFLVV